MKLEIHSQMNIQIIRKHENINFDIITSSLLSSFFVLLYIYCISLYYRKLKYRFITNNNLRIDYC